MFSAALYAHVRTSSTIAHETAGAARIRHSLRPLFGEGVRIPAKLGRIAPREHETAFTVIARSEAIEAIHLSVMRRYGLLRFARNDGIGAGERQ